MDGRAHHSATMHQSSIGWSDQTAPAFGSRLFSKDGLTLSLGAQLTSGGEGRIFEVQNNPRLLAKIYLPENNPVELAGREAKIQAMLARKKLAGRGRYAWPVDTLRSLEQGQLKFRGFLMPRLTGHTLVTLTTPALLLARIPAAMDGEFLRLFLHRVLFSLATGLQELEEERVLVGDVSESNFLVDPKTGHVAFIDCDSFQVPAGDATNTVLPAGASTPEYLPPELLGSPGALVRTPEHVRFSAAVLFFLILTHGWHPYACKGAESPVENILSGRTAMGASHGLAKGFYPRPIFNIYREMHPALKHAFINTLVRGHRLPNFRTDFGAWQRAIITGTEAIERTIRVRGLGAPNQTTKG